MQHSKYVNLSRDMIDERLVGKDVIRGDVSTLSENPPMGKVVSGNRTSGYIWVSWSPTSDPERFPFSKLMLVSYDRSTTKTMKYSGKDIASVERFCRNVRAEGGGGNTMLNPHKMEYVSFQVQLPVATDKPDRVDLLADDVVAGTASGLVGHSHDSQEVCSPPCPQAVPYRKIKDNPQA